MLQLCPLGTATVKLGTAITAWAGERLVTCPNMGRLEGPYFQTNPDGGFHNWGYPKFAGWLIEGKIPLKWMMTGGTPISGNLLISINPLEGKKTRGARTLKLLPSK